MADIMQYTDAAFESFRSLVRAPRHPAPTPATPVAGQFRESGSDLFLSLHPNKSVVSNPTASAHTHSYAELVYVHRGTLHQQINGERVTMPEGSLMLLGSGAIHQPWVDTDKDIVVNLGVRFDALAGLLARFNTVESSALSRLDGLLPGSRPGSAPSALYIQSAPTLAALVNEMFCEYYRQDEWAEHVLMSDMVRLIVELCRTNSRAPGARSPDPEDADALLSAIRRYIEQHYTGLSMEELSAHFSYSQRQMRRLLRELSEDGLPGMLNKLRIQRACEFMARGSMPTNEIMARVGFNDPAYFSRVFKSITGLSVREFRDQLAIEI